MSKPDRSIGLVEKGDRRQIHIAPKSAGEVSRVPAAIVLLAFHNVVQNCFLNERGYVTGNAFVASALLDIGRSSGLSWADMGFHRGDVQSGMRMAVRASVLASATLLAAAVYPQTRPVLRDERAVLRHWSQLPEHVFIRFPVGTAFFEEVAFRGVLPALFARRRSTFGADAISAGLFALWHVIPTTRAISGNEVATRLSTGKRIAAIIAGAVAAGASGLAFSRMRRTTGSLLAPWLVHSSVNSLMYMASVAVTHSTLRRSGRSSNLSRAVDETEKKSLVGDHDARVKCWRPEGRTG